MINALYFVYQKGSEKPWKILISSQQHRVLIAFHAIFTQKSIQIASNTFITCLFIVHIITVFFSKKNNTCIKFTFLYNYIHYYISKHSKHQIFSIKIWWTNCWPMGLASISDSVYQMLCFNITVIKPFLE